MSNEHPLLHVYTASAGAGKTYTLTREYLALALVAPEEEFRRIIAMTFTNKATNEMKERIVEALYRLCFNLGEEGLLQELSSELGFTMEEIRSKCWKMLLALLGDYSSFKVKTIDSFFQEIIRTFAYELNYAGNYKIEMDAELWLYQSILLLLHSLHTPGYEDLRHWITELSEETIDEGQGHDLTKTLMRLGRELFKEIPLRAINTEDFPTKEEIRSSRRVLSLFLKQCDEERLHVAQNAIALMSQEGLEPASFKGKGRSPLSVYTKIVAYPEEVPSLTDSFLKIDSSDDYSEYLTDAIRKNEALYASYLRVIEGGLKECNKKLVRLHVQRRTASIILKHLSKLGTLSDINTTMYQLGQEQNTMLLGNSQHFIHRIIEGAPAPFIYERLGGTLHHLMLDEFQDTARLQYENLRPLLDDTLSSGYSSLIVGDIKQSIYKFRNCDRSILGQDLERDFDPYFQDHILEYNWRSCQEIVLFNNQLFSLLPQVVTDLLKEKIERSKLIFQRSGYSDYIPSSDVAEDVVECYATARQLVPPKNEILKGGVEVLFYNPEEESPIDINGEKNLPEILLSLIEDKGYAPEDIAILANKNDEVAEIAECLLKYVDQHPEKAQSLKFISARALLTTNSNTVRLVINLLRSLANPKDEEQHNLTEQHYVSLCLFQKDDNKCISFQEIIHELVGRLPYLAMYELVVSIIDLLQPVTSPEEDPYITHFLDLVYNFHCEQPTDIAGFITWWDTKGNKSQLPEEQGASAITLLTIHQSKGLGFPIVLLPYPTWSLSGMRNAFSFIWTSIPEDTRHELGIDLSLVALEKSSTQMSDSLFASKYFQELTDEIIDRLNLFYVAMTRAKKGLLLWLPKVEKEYVTDSLDSLLNHIFKHYNLEEYLAPIPPQEKKYATTSQKSGLTYSPRIARQESSNNITIQLKAKRAFQDTEAIQHGAVMHEILSEIVTMDDIERVVKKAVRDGKLLEREREKLEDRLRKELSFPLTQKWFASEVVVLNEQDILLPQKNNFYRPDRIILCPDGEVVVVDYKFGEEQKKYNKQVAHYVSLLESMGYKNVKGYLWYFREETSLISPVKRN